MLQSSAPQSDPKRTPTARVGRPRLRASLAAVAGMTVAAFAIPAQAVPQPTLFHYNPQIQNVTGSQADGYHIEIMSGGPITVTETFECGAFCGLPVAFTTANVTQVAVNDITIDYSGATVAQGQSVHVGCSIQNTATLTIVDSYWTLGGLPIDNSQGVATPIYSGDPSMTVVSKTMLFKSVDGGTPIAIQVAEGPGTSVKMANATITDGGKQPPSTTGVPTGTIFAQTSSVVTDAAFALDALTPQLEAGYGPPGPIMTLSNTATIPAMGDQLAWMWSALMAMLMTTAAAVLIKRRAVK